MSIRVALVGYGYWGPNLARSLFRSGKAEFVAVADTSTDRKGVVEKQVPGVLFIDSAEKALNPAVCDAVVIATPAETHTDLVGQALDAGLDVLVEKPLSLSGEDALRLTEKAEGASRVLMVGHTFEYNSAVERIRELLDSGELGEVLYGYAQRVNLGRVRDDIDAWWNLAPHDVSIFNFLFRDSPIRVWGQAVSRLNPGVADVVFATLEYPKNITAHIHVSWLDPSKERNMTLVGSEKMVIFDDMVSEGRLKVFDKKVIPAEETDQYGLYHSKLHSGDILIPRLPMVEPLAAEIDHFLDCVANRSTPRSDGRGGLRCVRALEAVSRSIENGGGPVMVERD